MVLTDMSSKELEVRFVCVSFLHPLFFFFLRAPGGLMGVFFSSRATLFFFFHKCYV